MNERRLIGNILADNDSDEEYVSRFTTTKRHVLLNKEELDRIEESRSGSAPPSLLTLAANFWTNPEPLFSQPKHIEPSPEPIYASTFASAPFTEKPWQVASVLGGNINENRFDIAAPEFVPGNTKARPVDAELLLLKGRMHDYACDQAGSRHLQQKLETGSDEDKHFICEELMSSALLIANNVFGNYVVQKVFEFGSRDFKRLYADTLVGKVVSLSMQMYGCRVVQKALEFVTLEQRRLLAGELRGNVERCVEDQNGNHVIQKCIEFLPYEYCTFIIEPFRTKPVQWALHKYGCRVMQRIVENCPRQELREVLETLTSNALSISKEPYGNYVIQHIFDKGNFQDKEDLIRVFRGKVKDLSKHKFSSNVIEKALLCTHFKQAIIDEVFEEPALFELMCDRYGNFVVQKCIEAVKRDSDRDRLIAKVLSHNHALRSVAFGRHVLTFVEKLKRKQKP
mmetsp:Transcript_28791/g.51235  ORF Transcript_28791/g.51235 Transcript_28791/m.51235 type:complete len:454 (+) Transcript_28791:4314-5675(+)